MTRKQEGGRLEGLTVAITGRLASMTREAAVERIVAAGGRYAEELSADVALLVYGRGAPPLGRDGRPTRKLVAARELEARGVPLRVVPEEELLALLGMHERQADLHRLYTTEQLARILDVRRELVRAWVRHELIRPVRRIGRLSWFDFQQVATARALCELAQGGVSPAQIRKSLQQLAGWLPETERSLAQLAALEEGGTLLVRRDDGSLVEPSGQLRLGFEQPVAAPARPAGPPAAVHPELSAEEWFERGVRAEDAGQFEEAAHAYLEAGRLGGPRAEVAFNLGNVYYAMGRLEAASQGFRDAARIEPDYVEAWNNLGNVLCELERSADAGDAYRRALAIAPEYADAHYNFAELLFARGDLPAARAHFVAYLAQDPGSSWAEFVRGRLAELARCEARGPGTVHPLRRAGESGDDGPAAEG